MGRTGQGLPSKAQAGCHSLSDHLARRAGDLGELRRGASQLLRAGGEELVQLLQT